MIRLAKHNILLVSNQNHRSSLLMKLCKKLHNLDGGSRIQIACGLICQDQRRFICKSPGNGHSLALSSDSFEMIYALLSPAANGCCGPPYIRAALSPRMGRKELSRHRPTYWEDRSRDKRRTQSRSFRLRARRLIRRHVRRIHSIQIIMSQGRPVQAA